MNKKDDSVEVKLTNNLPEDMNLEEMDKVLMDDEVSNSPLLFKIICRKYSQRWKSFRCSLFVVVSFYPTIIGPPPSLIKWHIDVLDCSVTCPLADATPDFSNSGLTAPPTEQGVWLHVRTGAHTEESGHACDFRRLAPNRELACARCYGLILPVCHSSEVDTVNRANTEKRCSHNAYIFSVQSRTNTQNAHRWVIVLLPGARRRQPL